MTTNKSDPYIKMFSTLSGVRLLLNFVTVASSLLESS